MNPNLTSLHAYPFEKLTQLTQGLTPPANKVPISLSLGEPQHDTPVFIADELSEQLSGLKKYPSTKGLPQLRESIGQWLAKRYQLKLEHLDPERHVLPLNGTREGLFSIAQSVVDRSNDPIVAMPNPFYQIYEGAALLAGAEPYYLNSPANRNFVPEFDKVPDTIWDRCQLLYICNPGNPSGAIIDMMTLQQLIQLADRHNFVIASDECYSEIYADEDKPPVGLLQAANAMGNVRFEKCVVFHSLSKRSNAPGLRSGFAAGDADVLRDYLLYRTYHGCAMPLPNQMASIKAWSDETHVHHNRHSYRQKFAAVKKILADTWPMEQPPASFYLWPETPISDTEFAKMLYAKEHVTVLPGSFLSRPTEYDDPGRNRVRIALVATMDECEEAAHRINNVIRTL